MRRQGIEQEAARKRVVLTFLTVGGREVREANRISFDGNGGLVVYDGDRQERLLLSRISRLRIISTPPPKNAGNLLPESVAVLA